ncbi:DNA topoisomerase 3-alpha [Bienertia sinuspersici]
MSEERRQIKCYCGLPIGRRTSWTDRNPGRKFMCCKFYEPETEWRGCNFFNWIDEDMTEWQRNVIDKLVLEMKLVEAQLDAAHNEVKELQSQRSLLLYENDTLKLKYKATSAERKMKKGSNINRGGVV